MWEEEVAVKSRNIQVRTEEVAAKSRNIQVRTEDGKLKNMLR